MVDIFITSKYLSLLLVPLFLVCYLNKETILSHRLFYGCTLGGVTIYSIVPWLEFPREILFKISVMSLAVVIASATFEILRSYIDNTALRQKKRALKKIPLFVIIIFYSLSNLSGPESTYAMIGLAFVLIERSYRVAFFSWPFFVTYFFGTSAIIEALIILSQSVGVFLLRERE